MGTAIAGRSTPGMRRSSSRPAASIAPVLPADTTASASPSDDRAHAETSELSGLERTASAGFSCISMTPWVSRSSRPPVFVPARAVQDRRQSVGGRLERACDDLRRPAVAPHRVDRDPRHSALGSVDAERLDLAALVRPAVRARVMRPLRLPAVRADVHLRRLDRVRRAPLVAARTGLSSLRDGHERRAV